MREAQATMAPYEGTAVLETMAEAANYNAWLAGVVIAEARAAAGGRVLDFGAGCGTTAGAVTAAGFAVDCVEPDGCLRERLRAAGLPAHAALPDDRRYDFIYSLNVLEHVDEDRRQLRALRSALRPGGRLLLYVPAFMCLYSAFDRAVGHRRRYRRGDLCARLADAGFTVTSAAYADSLGFLAGLAYRVAGPRDGSLDRRGLTLYDRAVFPLSRRLDRVTGRLVGKNLLVTATAP